MISRSLQDRAHILLKFPCYGSVVKHSLFLCGGPNNADPSATHPTTHMNLWCQRRFLPGQRWDYSDRGVCAQHEKAKEDTRLCPVTSEILLACDFPRAPCSCWFSVSTLWCHWFQRLIFRPRFCGWWFFGWSARRCCCCPGHRQDCHRRSSSYEQPLRVEGEQGRRRKVT